MRVDKQKKQQGFIILMGMLALVLGAAVWFGTAANLRSTSMSISEQATHIDELKRIKDRMLTYAVMHPELFSDSGYIPGPGYFPCPDIDGDGIVQNVAGVVETTCGNGVNVVLGMVPHKISSRVFTFIDQPFEAGRYWYAVDSRFTNNNPDFIFTGADGTFTRFPSLNISSPANANLTLDGRADYVMVLFYASDAIGSQNRSNFAVSNFLEQENADGDVDFISYFNDKTTYNDYVIGITREEWLYAVLSRIGVDVNIPIGEPDLCSDVNVTTEAPWFEACENDTNPTADCPADLTTIDDNLSGQNWRSVLGCP